MEKKGAHRWDTRRKSHPHEILNRQREVDADFARVKGGRPPLKWALPPELRPIWLLAL